MRGQVSREREVNVPASQAWEVYGTLQLAKLVVKEIEIFEDFEVIEGDGGVGTILYMKFAPGTPGYPGFKEKFTKVDNEKRIKETEIIEGGYLDMGFILFRAILEIVEKGCDSCVIKSAIEYELKPEAAANASNAAAEMLEKIEEISKNYLINNKA